jgi:hypothetical protein
VDGNMPLGGSWILSREIAVTGIGIFLVQFNTTVKLATFISFLHYF